MKKPTLKAPDIKKWVQNSKQKELEARNQESTTLKMMTFIITFAAMAVGMSLLPLFPTPLPILIAALVALVTFKDPRFGMPVGGLIIGLGLMYQLSLSPIYFISYLGSEETRVAFVVIWLALFIIPAVLFRRYKAALAIDFGILSVCTLFFAPIYFLAIPIIIASAVYFKKYASLSIVYYVLISVPLMISQYYGVIKTIAATQVDWWTVPGSSPPVFTSLSPILGSLNNSMSQFRLYDASQFVYAITGQFTWQPNILGINMGAALSQYLDSLPGIIMLVVILAGLSSGILFFTKILTSEGIINAGDRFFPCFIATMASALFFIFLGFLSYPLAFTADISATTMVFGILSTLALTLPTLFIDFTPKQTATIAMVTQKARSLMDRLNVFDGQITKVKDNIPVVVSSPQGKMLILKDSLQDIATKAEADAYGVAELNSKFDDLRKISVDIDGLESELNGILSVYQVFVTCEYNNWVGKLKEAGLKLKSEAKFEFQKEMTLDERITAIQQVLDAGRALAMEAADVADPIYQVIRPLYDPALPEQSRAVEFTKQKIEQKDAPWLAIEALYNSLNNWKRQYGTDILTSIRYLQNSLAPIVSLGGDSEVLPPIFGSNMPRVLDYAKRAQAMKTTTDRNGEEALNILDVIALKDDIQSFLGISKDVLGMLYVEVAKGEDTVDRLLPTKDYLWQPNSTLKERLKKATDALSNPEAFKINQVMQNLPDYLSYVDEAVQTLAVYNERKEFLLNYPTAEAAIEEQLKTKKALTPKDLPFQPRFAAEYLRLYYTQRFSDYTYDKENQQLAKRK